MRKYSERFTEQSVWITATPTPFALSLPFYIMEAGHFWAERDYHVRRKHHESFLLLYTVEGCGTVKTQETELRLPPKKAVVIDCHTPHEYYSEQGSWEFIWFHMNGAGIPPLFHALYPDSIRAIDTQSYAPAAEETPKNPRRESDHFADRLTELMGFSHRTDIAGYIQISSALHSMFHLLFLHTAGSEAEVYRDTHAGDVRTVVDFIQKHYAEMITVDDMIRDIPVSKYHFIRIFRRVMGTTPYSYLMNYRITMSKELLHSTDLTIAEIAEKCGFLDTSNFSAQFKKHTGQRPLQYRNAFGIFVR